MAENDFDVDGLARYLHITPQQVERLTTRGKIPARRVAGQWRFSTAEIHHWLEERMGLLEDGELLQMEGALARADNMEWADISIAAALHVETIAVPLQARTKGAVIEKMTQLATSTGSLWDPQRMAEAIRNREQLQSTAMDNGVALLHPRRPLANSLAEPVLALGITGQGIPFGGSHRLTDIFFLICSTDDRGHLRTLARLSRLVADDSLLNSLRAATDPTEVYDIMRHAEETLVA